MTPYDYALIAHEAYSAAPDIGVADSASRAIVRRTDEGLVIAFRGSDDVDAWLHDFEAVPDTIAGLGKVHEGFWSAWSAIAEQVMAVVGSDPVTFVGHSLGGGLASIAAASAVLAGKSVKAVYGFEPPRPSFDTTMRTLLANTPVYLYKNGSDPVPDVPIGGVHPASLIHIGKQGEFFPRVEDHLMPNVLASLAALKTTG